MSPLETYALSCPWCGEVVEILIDLSAGNQCYVEDCQVCCAPMVVSVRIDLALDTPPEITLSREGD